jgi:hypothetical protein
VITKNTIAERPAAPRTFTHEQISKCARLVWERKGRPEGQDEEIWLETEQRLIDWHHVSPDEGGAMANPEITFNSFDEPVGAIENWMSQFGTIGSDRSATSL